MLSNNIVLVEKNSFCTLKIFVEFTTFKSAFYLPFGFYMTTHSKLAKYYPVLLHSVSSVLDIQKMIESIVQCPGCMHCRPVLLNAFISD